MTEDARPGQRIARAILAVALAGLGIWTLHRFLPALVWACILAVAVWPYYARLARHYPSKGHNLVLPTLFTGGIALLILIPMAIAGVEAGREAVALAASPEITNSQGGSYGSGEDDVVLANSMGFLGTYRTSSVSLSVVPVAERDGHMERDYWYTSGRGLSDLLSPEEVGRIAAERTLRRLGARKAPRERPAASGGTRIRFRSASHPKT